MERSLLVLSSYPRQGKIHGPGTVGIASYTKNTLLSIMTQAPNSYPKIVVLAEQLDDQNITYEEAGIEVRRIWKLNNIFSYLWLVLESAKLWKFKKVLIEFELSMFGHFLYLTFFPLFLFILKILGKEIIFVSHQVVDDIGLLSGHIGLEKESKSVDILNIFICIFYKLTFLSVSKIIVFEDKLKSSLSKFAPKNKIIVIPHGVEQFSKTISKQIARKKLGLKDEFVILYFGFIAWYKGTDWIIDQFADSDLRGKKVKLIIAGGTNPNHKDNKFYTDYVKSVWEKVAKSKNAKVTGFVEEEDIPLYFNACDLVVLPYRTLMSSSGPLSMALSFKKPFIVSRNIAKIFETVDFRKLLNKFNINKEDIIFDMKDNSFRMNISRILINNEILRKLALFSREMNKSRSFEKIGVSYYEEIFI